MIYRGRCDRFMCFRQPGERWRRVHQGYWALSSFTLKEKEEAYTPRTQSVPHKTGPYNLHSFFELVYVWFWYLLIILKGFVQYLSSLIISRNELAWQQIDWPLWSPPPPPQSFFLWWVMHPLQATMVAVSGGEKQIWANYHNGLLYSGRRLINSPPGLHTKNDWSVQLSVFRCDFYKSSEFRTML